MERGSQRVPPAEEPPGWPGRKCTENCPLSLPRRGVRTPAHTVGSPTCPRAGCNQDFPPQTPFTGSTQAPGVRCRCPGHRCDLLISGALRVSPSTSSPWTHFPRGHTEPCPRPARCRHCFTHRRPPVPPEGPAISLPAPEVSSHHAGPWPGHGAPGPALPLAPALCRVGESRQDQLAFRVRAPADSSSSAQFTALFPVTNSAWR